MHMNNVFQKQRVSADLTFPDGAYAEDAAHKAVLQMINFPFSRISEEI